MKGKSKELIFSSSELKKSDPTMVKTEEFKKLENRCRSSSLLDTFSPMELKQVEDVCQVKFSILHAIAPKQQTNDAIDGVSSAQLFAPKKKFISFLDISFSPVGECWSLNFNSFSHTKFIEYDLNPLLNLICPALLEEVEKVYQKRRLSIGSLSLDTKQIKLPNPVQLDKLQVENFLKELSKHEGKHPSNDKWIPEGSIEKLQEALFPNTQIYIPK